MTLTCYFNARICFLRRFNWTRLHGFRKQLYVKANKERKLCQKINTRNGTLKT